MSAANLRRLDELPAELDLLRRAGRTIVLCHGVFDLLHIGHIRYLQEAAKLGEVLVVTVTPDRYVNKGPHRPVFGEALRVEGIAALGCVRFAALNETPTAVEAIRKLRPHVYAKGVEYRDKRTPELDREEAELRTYGGQLAFIDTPASSSSHLINNYLSPFPEHVAQYLAHFRERYAAHEITRWLDSARDLTLTVVGEAIIDEHYECSALGRSPKAPIVATRYESHTRHLGGALAVAHNAAAFCRQVRLVALVGADEEEAWIRQRLRDNVVCRLVRKEAAPTIVKRHYRESYFGSPLFEIDQFDDRELAAGEAQAVAAAIAAELNADGVLVADHGHSMLAPPAVQALCAARAPLCVSTHANAANFGRHTIAQYPRADFAVLARRELELACPGPARGLGAMLQGVAARLSARRAIVTLGKDGCLGLDRGEGEQQALGLSTTVADRSGGGDAFFAMSSIATVLGAPLAIASFLGNVAGAAAVARVGGSQHLDDLQLRRHIESLLK